MPKKRTISCPNKDVHGNLKEASKRKIIFAYEENGCLPPKKFWVHCADRYCNRWVEINFNELGGPSVEIMPEGHNFNFLKTPVMEMRK